MDQRSDRLPLSTVTWIFGSLSIPLAFLRHLCSLAVILGMLGMLFALWGSWYASRRSNSYSRSSQRWMKFGGIAALIGTAAGIVMWILYAENVLLR